MKSIIKQLFCLILSCSQVFLTQAMDPSFSSAATYEGRVTPSPLKASDYKLRFSPKDSPVADLIAAINETPQGGLIAMNGSFINQLQVVEALKNAENRGVRLELCVDARKSENKILLEQLAREGLHATCGLHTKRCILYDVDPKDDLEFALRARSAKLFTGSENLSNNAGTHHEYTFISSNPELVKRHYKDHLKNKAVCGAYAAQETASREMHRAKVAPSAKKSVPLSPRFTRIYNSQKYDSGKLKEARIAKPVPVGANECIYLSSMGFDDKVIARALLSKALAGSDITLVVDNKAVKSSKGRPLLNQLHQAKVKIYVWKRSSFQHTKLLLRERRNKLDNHYLDSLCVLSTGNLVKNSSTEINYDQIVPDSHIVSQDIRAYFDTLIPQCTPFANIDQAAIVQSKLDKGKDLFSLTCGTCQEVIRAPAEVTLIKKLIKHCIESHQGNLVDSVAIAGVTPKTVSCGTCATCSEPFYTARGRTTTTYAIAQHLVKDHAVAAESAEKARETMSIDRVALHIAKKDTQKK